MHVCFHFSPASAIIRGVKSLQAAAVFHIQTAILLSSIIAAFLVALAHPIPAAASLDALMPYGMAP